MLLVTNGRVITRDAGNAYLENGAVAIDGEKIAEVGPAAELADVYTDPEGNVLNPRKVGSALARAAREGLIAKSPEKWSVAHYAPHGVEFAPKPKRVKKSEQTEDTPEDVTED